MWLQKSTVRKFNVKNFSKKKNKNKILIFFFLKLILVNKKSTLYSVSLTKKKFDGHDPKKKKYSIIETSKLIKCFFIIILICEIINV